MSHVLKYCWFFKDQILGHNIWQDASIVPQALSIVKVELTQSISYEAYQKDWWPVGSFKISLNSNESAMRLFISTVFIGNRKGKLFRISCLQIKDFQSIHSLLAHTCCTYSS